MILKAGESVLDIPALAVASIALVHAPAGKVRMRTALMRVAASDMRARNGEARGQPVIWAPDADARVRVWPTPDVDYLAELRSRAGEMIGDPKRKRAETVPIEQHVAVIAKAAEEARRLPGRVERFSLIGNDDE